MDFGNITFAVDNKLVAQYVPHQIGVLSSCPKGSDILKHLWIIGRLHLSGTMSSLVRISLNNEHLRMARAESHLASPTMSFGYNHQRYSVYSVKESYPSRHLVEAHTWSTREQLVSFRTPQSARGFHDTLVAPQLSLTRYLTKSFARK